MFNSQNELQILFPLGGGDHLSRLFLRALQSFEAEDLEEAMDLADEQGYWPIDVRDDLKGLQRYRAFYTKGRLETLDPNRRYQAEEYGWRWTIELAQRMFGFVPRDLYGMMPLPPELQAMQPKEPGPVLPEPSAPSLNPPEPEPEMP